MGRTARLALTVTHPEHGEACLLCAKAQWLGERLRKFHKHIAKEERILRAEWQRNIATLMPDFKEYDICLSDLKKWEGISSRLVKEMERRTTKLKTRQALWRKSKGQIQVWFKKHKLPVRPVIALITDKITRLEKRIKRYEALIKKVPARVENLKISLKDYEGKNRKAIAKYVEANFPLPIHLQWDKKLTRVLTRWQDDHPVCIRCGLRFGGFHLGQEHSLASGDQVCQFCLKELRSQRVPVYSESE